MSFPYDLDLIYGGEKSTADPIGRLSFGKPVVVGDKVIFRSSLYNVSNDYIMSPNIDEPGWYPSFNDETIKNAYTEFEFDREAFNKIGSIDHIDGLVNVYIKSTEDTQFFLSYLYLTFLIDDGESLYTKSGNIFLSDVDLTKIDPTDMTDPFFESFLLTTLHTHLYFQDHDDETGSPYFSKSIPCTIRTVIEGKENNNSTYIPVIMNGSELIPVEEVIDYTHRTATFPVLIPSGKGYERGENVYFEVQVETDNSDAKDKILNWSVFNLAEYNGGIEVILTTNVEGIWDRDYTFYSAHIQVCDYSDGYIETSTFTGDLQLEEYHSDDYTSTVTNIGTVNLKLVSAATGADMSEVCLCETTSGTCLIKL